MPLVAQSPGPLIVGIGEALFDRIPGKGDHLGGAPLNFAVHAQQMLSAMPTVGGRSVLVSRVGDDVLGERLLACLRRFGVETEAIQIDDDRSTGVVDVLIDEDGPSYRIRENAAWDQIAYSDRLDALSHLYDAVCYGTLARRGSVSASTVERFVRNGADRGAIRMYDINLRSGATGHDLIVRGLELASIAKMNDEELPIVAEMVGAEPGDEAGGALAIIDAFRLDQLMLTRGARGVIVYTSNEAYEGLPSKANISPESDVVGAGDSCGAAYVIRTLCGDDAFAAATVANQVGAYVASNPGATPLLPAYLFNAESAESLGKIATDPIVPWKLTFPR